MSFGNKIKVISGRPEEFPPFYFLEMLLWAGFNSLSFQTVVHYDIRSPRGVSTLVFHNKKAAH